MFPDQSVHPVNSLDRLLSAAEFSRPTRFQRHAIPEQLKGGNILYETSSGDGKTAAYCAPAVARAAGFKRKTLVLCLEEPLVDKALRTIRLLNRNSSRHVAVLSLQQQVRNKSEAERLDLAWEIATGQPARAIDAIRMGTLDLGGVRNVVIDAGDTVPDDGTLQDLEFIFSKFPAGRQVTVLSSRPAEAHTALATLVPGLRVVERSVWDVSCVEHHAIILPAGRDSASGLVDLIFAHSLEHLWILCENSCEAQSMTARLVEAGIPAASLANGFQISSSSTLNDFSTGRLRALVTTPARSHQEEEQAESLGNVVFTGPFYTARDYDCAVHFLEESRPGFSITTLFSYDRRSQISNVEEMINVAFKKEDFPVSEDVMRGILADYMDKIRHDENPDEMNAYRKLIQQSVPFFMRSYFSAYLFKQVLELSGRQPGARGRQGHGRFEDRPERGERPARSERAERPDRSERPDRPGRQERGERQERRPERQDRSDRSERPDRPERRSEPAQRLPESESVTLFIGIGKNRRVYAKDIIQLFGTANVDRSKLGLVKIMDNYSFIQIATDVADDAILALNGSDFHGRKLVVNYARKKGRSDEEPQERAPLAEEPASQAVPVTGEEREEGEAEMAGDAVPGEAAPEVALAGEPVGEQDDAVDSGTPEDGEAAGEADESPEDDETVK